jgi:hypothetical protein
VRQSNVYVVMVVAHGLCYSVLFKPSKVVISTTVEIIPWYLSVLSEGSKQRTTASEVHMSSLDCSIFMSRNYSKSCLWRFAGTAVSRKNGPFSNLKGGCCRVELVEEFHGFLAMCAWRELQSDLIQ